MAEEIYFSIIIPTFNRLKELNNCLKSLELQTYKNFEVIIVDDKSSTDISATLNTEKFSFLVYIYRNLKNMGAAKSRNIGIENSHYNWIAFLDDDDIWTPNKLFVLSQAIEGNIEVDFIYHNAEIIMVNENSRYITKREIPKEYFQKMLIKNLIGGTSMVIVKNTLFDKYGKFDEKLRSIEDYELWIRLSKHFKPLYINQPLTKYFYRTDCKSLNKDIESNLKSMAYIRNKYKDDIKKLSKKQMSEKYEYEFSSTAHRLLLNYNRTLSSKYYLKAFLVRLKVKFLIASIFSLLYPKLIFKLR